MQAPDLATSMTACQPSGRSSSCTQQRELTRDQGVQGRCDSVAAKDELCSKAAEMAKEGKPHSWSTPSLLEHLHGGLKVTMV